jgi:hypothetical protein
MLDAAADAMCSYSLGRYILSVSHEIEVGSNS